MVNGDTLFDVPLNKLGAFLDGPDVEAAVGLRPMPDTGRYGRVELEEDRITGFSEKVVGGPGLINGGTYVLRKSAIRGWAPPFSIEKDLLPELVDQGRVRGVPCDGFLIDIGLPETLLDGQSSVPAWWNGLAAG